MTTPCIFDTAEMDNFFFDIFEGVIPPSMIGVLSTEQNINVSNSVYNKDSVSLGSSDSSVSSKRTSGIDESKDNIVITNSTHKKSVLNER